MVEPEGFIEASDSGEGGSPPLLKDQAETFRHLIREKGGTFHQGRPSAAKTLTAFLLVLTVVGAVVLLLVDSGERRRLLVLASGSWIESYQRREDPIVRLPPPPPNQARAPTVSPRVILPPVRVDEEPQGVLFLDIQPGGQAETAEDAEPPLVEKNPSNEAAYRLLMDQSEVAAKVVAGELAEYQFQSWTPVKDEPPVFWVDITVLSQSEGREVHLIWAIDVEAGRVDPLSQAARDLERR